MITGILRRSSLPSRRTLSAALTSIDSCLSHSFTSAATGISVERNLIGIGSNVSGDFISGFAPASSPNSIGIRARDFHIRSEPAMVFPARIAFQGYATERESSVGDSKSVSKIRISPKNAKQSSKKVIAPQKEGEESTSKIKGTRICIAIRSFDNPEKQAWCLPPHSRKVAMPDTRVLYTVLRSPHVDKKSREQFEMRFKKRFLVIRAQSHELSKKLFWLKRYRILGAQYELQFHCKTRLDMAPVLGNINGSSIGQ
ncbi:40S ribosomal protein S10, mitochondrial isoform X2 [Eutrema salsugineum]|uniref:40S ribosomal protein S10, mitochondrial isoform X2 n=1 Tax=Eutrema salsugineum TaxID=72664 RepID=UPI000CECF222|nr:40S ribosomal protein S10, mitochondrial isoform X2 [Eutrema salsugineum]